MSSYNKFNIHTWRVGVLPGLVILGLTIAIRLTGGLQFQEWLAFDTFLKTRRTETKEERITIIGIDETDIAREGYPIPDKELAALLESLQQYKPRAIALDLAKNKAEPELIEVLKKYQNQFAVEKVLPEIISPPPGLPSEQVGFIDVYPDRDSRLRRILLGTHCEGCSEFKYSLVLRLAKEYLAAENIALENGIRDRYAMRFGSIELPRFHSHTGGYTAAESNGVQMLLNFRSGSDRFRILSLNDIQTGNFAPNWLEDRIILIGMTAPSTQDIQNSAVAVSSKLPSGKIYGIEVIAHGISQILSAVQDDRHLIKTWSEPGEYLWIIFWGGTGIILAGLPLSPWKNIVAVGIAASALLSFCYIMLVYFGWWLPVVPASLVLVLNGLVLTSFYYQERSLLYRLQERQSTIDLTYDSIHNGPLQTLKMLIRKHRDLSEAEASSGQAEPGCGADRNIVLEESLTELIKLDREMRDVYESLYLETSNPQFELSKESTNIINLDWQQPLHELLNQVYRQTMARKFPYFGNLKVVVPDIQPIDDRYLNKEHKRGICQVLEEALCNVGQSAKGVTRLEICCYQKSNSCVLRIKDNGAGLNSTKKGRGTKLSERVARKLKGKFQREKRSPKGTVCELTWHSKPKSWFGF